MGVAAFVFPDRRPDLYRASPANINWLGIPVLKIVAPLSILVMIFLPEGVVPAVRSRWLGRRAGPSAIAAEESPTEGMAASA